MGSNQNQWTPFITGAASLLGVVVALVGTLITTWRNRVREDRIRKESQEREDRLRKEQQDREDQHARERYNEWAAQRWWDRKAAAYTDIVEALWRLSDYSRMAVDEIERQLFVLDDDEPQEPDPQQAQTRRERFYEDTSALKKIVGIGAFVISEEVISILDAYFKRTAAANEMDLYGQAEEHLAAAKDCLAGVREGAMRDLRLHPPEIS